MGQERKAIEAATDEVERQLRNPPKPAPTGDGITQLGLTETQKAMRARGEELRRKGGPGNKT